MVKGIFLQSISQFLYGRTQTTDKENELRKDIFSFLTEIENMQDPRADEFDNKCDFISLLSQAKYITLFQKSLRAKKKSRMQFGNMVSGQVKDEVKNVI